ncbi:flagellar hook-associated protein 3 [Geobacter sp. FeAm09]|uniref:flagellar hook-associated protein FlgL n=1 Tax=Geobacter sp. FeAm09 TaxID=2597769 RepID=UPI0011F0643E|nr:flagellar hook-associated protein FlgL [Geobacter sp. FeAm09]QEM68025.1 flagellar hook-associated protein 3 [Geobacter sp. FeAm09]
MRISSNTSAINSIYNLQKGQATFNRLTELTTSEQNVNRPSDDPTATSTLLNIGDTLKAIDKYSTNITKATTFLTITNNALTGISDTISQAKELVASISDGSDSATERQSVHDQLVSLKKQIIDYANTQSGDNTYVFGGTSNSTAPFSYTSNSYGGDGNQSQVEIAENSYQSLTVTGDRLLKGAGSNPSYGSTDILQTLDNLISAVGDSTTASDATAIQQGAKDLEAGASQINNAQIDVAARMKRLETMATMNTNSKNTLENVVSDIQNVDLTTVGVQLSQQQSAYEAALAATAKISSLSLLDYL